jgi:hypothetical protein
MMSRIRFRRHVSVCTGPVPVSVHEAVCTTKIPCAPAASTTFGLGQGQGPGMRLLQFHGFLPETSNRADGGHTRAPSTIPAFHPIPSPISGIRTSLSLLQWLVYLASPVSERRHIVRTWRPNTVQIGFPIVLRLRGVPKSS